MTAVIKIKRSEVSGNPAVLGAGELAYSGLADNGSNGGDRLYIGMGTETAGNAVNRVVVGGKFFTDQITASTAVNTVNTLVRRDASGNFAANTITAALAGNATTASAWLNARSIALTGDATATFASVDGSSNVTTAITLATVNLNVGTFGSTTLIPVVTVNAKGLVTAVTTAEISTVLNVAGSTGTGTIALATDTLTIAGGTGVTSAYNNTSKTTTLSIGQAVGTTDNVTFNNVTVNGTLTSDDITSTNISVAGNATITGNLTVSGTTTTVNSTAVAITDINLTLAKDAADATAANGAGLTVAGANATLTYTSANDRWNLNKDLVVANVIGALSGNATTATTLATARTINGVSFDGSANITITAENANALTIGDGLSGTSYNGSTAVTIAADSTIARRADATFIGTTSVALNRASANLALTGISSVTLPGATSGSTTLQASAVAGTNVITLPTTTGTVITSGDSGTVTNTMLAGSIANDKLTNSSVTVGTTAIALGDSSTTLAGLTSVTSASFTGALTGNASTATTLATARAISITGDATWTTDFDGSAAATGALTLATVNTNVGSFGSATSVPNITVNAKGLVIAVNTTAIPTATSAVLGLASFNSVDFTVTSGAVTIAQVDGGTY